MLTFTFIYVGVKKEENMKIKVKNKKDEFYTAKNDLVFKAIFCDVNDTFLLKTLIKSLKCSLMPFLLNRLQHINNPLSSYTSKIYIMGRLLHITLNPLIFIFIISKKVRDDYFVKSFLSLFIFLIYTY